MKRNIVTAFFIVICFILQCTLFQALTFGNISPNILIIITSTYGFMNGKKYGLTVGFFCGLLIDIFCGEVIGFYALIYMYIGYFNGYFKRLFYKEDIKLPIILIIGSDITYCFVTYCLLFLLRSRFSIGYYLSQVILPEIVYTILITMIFYPIILFVNRKLDNLEKRSAN